MKKIISISIIVLLFVSCNISHSSIRTNLRLANKIDNKLLTKEAEKNATKRVPLNFTNKVILASSLYDVKDIIYLESNTLLGEIDKILYFAGKYFIMDQFVSEKVCCFDATGKHSFDIGSKGHGPGEYLALYDFTIDIYSNQILIYDGQKVNYYSMNGEFVRSRRVGLFGKNLAILDNVGSLLFCSGNTIYNEDLAFNLILVDSKDSIQSLNMPICDLQALQKHMPWSYFCANDTSLYYIESYNDTIYQILKNEILPQYVMDFEEYTMTDEEKLSISLGEKQVSDKAISGLTFSLQNDSTLFALSSNKNQFIFTYYDKNKEKSKSFSLVQNDLTGFNTSIIPKGIIAPDCFIVPVDPYIIHAVYEDIQKRMSPESFKQLMENKEAKTFMDIKNHTSNDSNPVLVIVKVKNQLYENI